MQKNSQRIGLALSGGSTFGIAHIGVIAALEEAGIPIHCISGTSAGAIVGAYLAFGKTAEEMYRLTEKLDWKRLSKFTFSRLGLKNNEPMATFLEDTLGAQNIEDAKLSLAIVATNIETHKMVILKKGPLNTAVRASTCLPGYFTPVEVEGQLLVDGGLTENVPLTALDELGATKKIAVNLLNASSYSRPKNMLDVLNKSVDILSLHRDQHVARQADVLIEPDLAAFNSMSFENAKSIYQAGYEAGKKAVPQIKEVCRPERRSAFFSILENFFWLFSGKKN